MVKPQILKTEKYDINLALGQLSEEINKIRVEEANTTSDLEDTVAALVVDIEALDVRVASEEAINSIQDADISTLNTAKADKSTTLTGQQSIAGGGSLAANHTFSLVNDVTSPAGFQFYGTSPTGTLGWNKRYNENVLAFQDDFAYGNATSGSIGSLCWAFATAAGGTIATIAGAQNHPGRLLFQSGTTNTSISALHTQATVAPFFLSDIKSAMWIVLMGSTLTNANFRCDLTTNTAAAKPANSIGFEYNKAGGDTVWFVYVVNNAGTVARTSTGITVAADTYYKLELKPNGSSWEFYINDVLKTTLSSGLPTAAAVSLEFQQTSNGTSNGVIPDYAHIVLSVTR